VFRQPGLRLPRLSPRSVVSAAPNKKPAQSLIGRLRHWLGAGEAPKLQPARHCCPFSVVA